MFSFSPSLKIFLIPRLLPSTRRRPLQDSRPSSGLTSADVDVQQLRSLMERYISNEDEWKKYAFADLSRGYTRNLVDEGNGKSNLLILVWTPGKGSLYTTTPMRTVS
ncbi:hypothetical protein DID88_004832 [Monilinia fructigena]|uniref:Cysteine dioxygenase n=1 Tax=Monilinia fructigena TaxID=38457 RepID=A0A395IQV2_9HELO|nr:hypothetical protein DID88_004832 [Monilinia fructigena]